MQTEDLLPKELCCQTRCVNCLGWCRVGIKMSAVEIRFENLSVAADVHVGGRALPTVLNSLLNFVEVSICRRVVADDSLGVVQDSCNTLFRCQSIS